MGQKVVSIRPHFPMMKHTPAKENKVHNGGGPYLRPDLCISWSLHVWGSPVRTWDSRSIMVRALTLTLILFPQLFWGPSSPETALSASQILPTKDLRNLLRFSYNVFTFQPLKPFLLNIYHQQKRLPKIISRILRKMKIK